MRDEYNIYADESCHLMHNEGDIMAFGAIWCPKNKARLIFERIRELKVKHELTPSHKKYSGYHKPRFEIKWNKVSKTKQIFYEDLIDFFFDDDDLHFRVLIVPNKKGLDHNLYNQTHDQFYYKMYFDMLKVILNPQHSHNIYIDIKDTRSKEKVDHLAEVLRNNHYDYSKQIIKRIQQVHSHEVELIQLADLLTGAVAYANRNLNTSKAKLSLVEKIKTKSKYSLSKSTLVREAKFNIFIWQPSLKGGENE
jgi:hypothetical protein